MQLRLDPDRLDDAAIAAIKDKIQRSGLYVSSLAVDGNHIDPDPAKREQPEHVHRQVHRTVRQAGHPQYRRTVRHHQGPSRSQQQVDEIVNVYNEKYFPACEKNKVRILWEPYAGGPNIATGPVGWEALFKAFNDSPHVGLQFDPSHLVWQFMDPVQAARDFVDKIYDVHLKDTEILWHVLRRGGIQPVNNARWWRFRVPGYGSVDWKGFFSVLSEAGYTGAMNIENEDEFYYPAYDAGEFHRAVQARLPRGARISEDAGAAGDGVSEQRVRKCRRAVEPCRQDRPVRVDPSPAERRIVPRTASTGAGRPRPGSRPSSCSGRPDWRYNKRHYGNGETHLPQHRHGRHCDWKPVRNCFRIRSALTAILKHRTACGS